MRPRRPRLRRTEGQRRASWAPGLDQGLGSGLKPVLSPAPCGAWLATTLRLPALGGADGNTSGFSPAWASWEPGRWWASLWDWGVLEKEAWGSPLNVSPLGVGYAGQGSGSSDEDRAPARKGFGGEVGAASCLPGVGGGTALQGEGGGPGATSVPVAPRGTLHVRLLSPATPTPTWSIPHLVLTWPEVTLCFRDGLCLQEHGLPGWLTVYCSFLKKQSFWNVVPNLVFQQMASDLFQSCVLLLMENKH